MNQPQGTRQSGFWILAAVCVSLLLHGLVMLLPRMNQTPLTEATRTIRLIDPVAVKRPDPVPPPEPEVAVEPPPSEPTALDQATITESDQDPENIRPMLPIVERSAEMPVDSTTEPFSQRVLANVRQLHRQIEVPDNNILEARPVPTLPEQPGWLNDYVGTVEPSVDRWKNTDGSNETRIVMANGQVVCGHARAPTTAELFNPQFATNIMSFRLCGRERPKPIDRTDPWQRGGPKPGER